MQIPADKCAHIALSRMPGPLPLYRCTACSSGFILNSYVPIPPGRFEEVARQIVGSEKLFARLQRAVDAADAGLVLLPERDGAEVTAPEP